MNILDCTIRDGGYATKNQWGMDGVRDIVKTLSESGIKYIEVGDSVGLGGEKLHPGSFTAKELFENTIPYKGDSKIGGIMAIGYGDKEDVRFFRECGGDFVRLGVDATEHERVFEYIEYSKSLGFQVFCNFLKTYALSTYQLVQYVQDVIDRGVDGIYIVDSAGGMMPDDVSKLVKAIKAYYDIPVGFHGHNNLLLANANSLAAVQAGADFVDATVAGLGRGAGNAQLESLAAILKKVGYLDDETDIFTLCDLSERVLAKHNTVNTKGTSKREISEGVNNFHSHYNEILDATANKYHICPEKLMQEVCDIDFVNPSDRLFDKVAERIANGLGNEIFTTKFYHEKY